MYRLVFLSLAVGAVAMFSTLDAMAQRDAGAKARGDYGPAFSRSPSRSSGGGARVYQPRAIVTPQVQTPQPQTESFRSFSYEPAPFLAGETVVVTAPQAKLMIGRQQVGSLRQGEQFKIIKELNGWLGAETEVDGRTVRGWVWQAYVASPEAVRTVPGARGQGSY